jgi:hypothetical protein
LSAPGRGEVTLEGLLDPDAGVPVKPGDRQGLYARLEQQRWDGEVVDGSRRAGECETLGQR